MGKTAKIPKKTVSQKKTALIHKKKPAKTARKSGKRSKAASEAKKAFILAGLLVVLSICISLIIITVHSNIVKLHDSENELAFLFNDKNDTEKIETVPPPLAALPVEETSKHDVSVSVQPSEDQTTAAPVTITTTVTNTTGVSSQRPAVTSARRPSTESPPAQKPVENLGTVAFVIDDAGNNLRELEPFLRIPFPLTIAVLPGLPYSAEAARRIRAAGKEVILHQPMEALGGQNPGPAAIYSGMSSDEIWAILKNNIAEVGPVVGINNHQGSKITMDKEAMETILNFCREHGLYFLDSRTTADTVVPVMASQMGMKITQRDTFIDNEQDRDSMLRYITSGLERARRNGSTVMIGHTWSPELAPLLAEQFPLLSNQGYTIKTASNLLK